MKNYDEFAEEVFREADRGLALKRKRAAAIRRYTFALASMFAIILTGTFVLKNDTVREALERRFNAQNIITDESSATATKTTDSPQSTTSSCTTTTIAGTFVTSSTFPHTSTSSTTTIATSTNVSQTDISTQLL